MEIPGGCEVSGSNTGGLLKMQDLEPGAMRCKWSHSFWGSQLIERCKSEQKECQMSQTD